MFYLLTIQILVNYFVCVQMRMGALTLLLGLHLAILSAHAAVRFTLELWREDDIVLEAAAQSSSSSSSSSSSNNRIGISGGVRIIDRSIAAHSSSSQSDSTSLSNTSREREAPGGGDIDRHGGKETRQCPLCMESMMHPSAPPCGHLFCWECLHTWISSNSNSNSSNSINGSNSCTVKCPVCRSLFKQQTVRALHGFS